MGNCEEMIAEIKEKYGLDAPKVFSAMRKVPREEFVDKKYRHLAFEDTPIRIGFGQTVSQPFTVAFMTSLLSLKGNEKVLEIGTGSGYQAATLSHLAKEVYTIEIIEGLARRAKKRLQKLGFSNVKLKKGSGEHGWKKHAPFDAIIITAAVEKEIPAELIEQLKDGGVIVSPISFGHEQRMMKFTKRGRKLIKREYGAFRFVPFIKENSAKIS